MAFEIGWAARRLRCPVVQKCVGHKATSLIQATPFVSRVGCHTHHTHHSETYLSSEPRDPQKTGPVATPAWHLAKPLALSLSVHSIAQRVARAAGRCPTCGDNPNPTTNTWVGRGEGVGGTQFVHVRSRMTIDPPIPTMPGRSTLNFHQPGRHCLHQVRSTVRRSASRRKGELHPSSNRT